MRFENDGSEPTRDFRKLEATSTTGMTIPDKINNIFKCIACNQEFDFPVELTCGHIGCKRCILGLSKCPLCYEVIQAIGWKNRNDVRNLHQSCKELLSLFEIERLEITRCDRDEEESPVPSPEQQRSSKCDKTPPAITSESDNQYRSMSELPSTTLATTEEDTAETYFDANSEGFRPYTPLEPYPYATQLMPGTTSEEAQENPRQENDPSISTTQKMPVIDTQVFTPWDTQEVEVDDKSQVELLHEGDEVENIRLTQSQPLDLTLQHEPEFDEDDANSTSNVPYGPRKLAFQPSPSPFLFPPLPILPLDLRVPSDSRLAITVAGEIDKDTGLTQLRLPPAIEPIPQDFNSQFTSPVTQRFVERLAALEAPNPLTQNRPTTPERSKSVESPNPIMKNGSAILNGPTGVAAPNPTTNNRSAEILCRSRGVEAPNPITKNGSAILNRSTGVEAPKPKPSTQIRPTATPKRSKDKLDTSGRKLDLENIAEANAEFGDEDDRLLLEVEDCVNLVNGNKRRPEEGEDEEGSDDECFPLSIPEAKRPKIYTGKRVPDRGSPRNGHGQPPVPSPPQQPMEPSANDEHEQELLRCQEDLFASSWTPTPPEILMEPVSPVRKFVFCTTRLNSEQLRKLEKLCILCGGEIRKDLSADVTHLLLQMENNRILYTLKYLMAIAGKKWILTFDWVEECLREGRVVPEEPYETSNFPGSDPGVQISRKSTTNLFHDFNFYVPCDLKSSSISAAACKELLSALGGVVLEDLPLCNKRLLIIGDMKNSTTMNYRKLYETRRWLTVAWDWILDCVLSYKLVPFLAQMILTPGVDGIVLSQVSVPRPLLSL